MRCIRRSVWPLAGINEQTIGTLFRNRPKHLPYKYGQPIAEALHMSIKDLYEDDPMPDVVIGPIDQSLSLPSGEDLASEDYKLQQIILAYKQYKNPKHHDALYKLAVQQLIDEF